MEPQNLNNALAHTFQLFAWDFNVFELERMTKGSPLVTVTLTLLENYQLLVRHGHGHVVVWLFIHGCVHHGCKCHS